ncbi:MAG: hypothetical protein AB7O97_06690 [Planctomycetota bacterium]
MSRSIPSPVSPFGTLLPWCALGGVIAVLTAMSCLLLDVVGRDGGARAGSLPLYLTAGSCLLAAVSVVVLQAARVSDRVVGPERRLVESLRRLRSGDLSFRVSLRRGDLLTDLAAECNRVLEWLNANPPAGARTGTDVFEVEVEAAEPVEEQFEEVRS